MAETYPGFVLPFWTGLFAPAALPEAVADRLRTALAQVMADPAMRATLLRAAERVPFDLSPSAFARMIAEDAERFRTLIEDLGIRPG